MASVDEILKSPALPRLQRVSERGGDRAVLEVRMVERPQELHETPAGALSVLARGASAEAVDYRLDVALRRAGVRGVAAVAAFCLDQAVVWQPPVTALDIADRADLALLSMPPDTELAGLIEALTREIAGGAEAALRRIELGLEGVSRAETHAGERVLERLREHFTDLQAACGAGGAHEGPMGLRASAVEARDAAIAARAAGRHSRVAAFDAVGLQRMLTEWYAFDTARQSVREQLAPLERLGQSAWRQPSAPSRPTSTSSARSSVRRGRCTCTATRSATACSGSSSCSTLTPPIPTSAWRCSSPAERGCSDEVRRDHGHPARRAQHPDTGPRLRGARRRRRRRPPPGAADGAPGPGGASARGAGAARRAARRRLGDGLRPDRRAAGVAGEDRGGRRGAAPA